MEDLAKRDTDALGFLWSCDQKTTLQSKMRAGDFPKGVATKREGSSSTLCLWLGEQALKQKKEGPSLTERYWQTEAIADIVEGYQGVHLQSAWCGLFHDTDLCQCEVSKASTYSPEGKQERWYTRQQGEMEIK
ncbi:hypothetical protein STEG23_015496, partial [Scotinomys teguina]